MNPLVLDTNVVSELMRPNPDPAVVGWLRDHPDAKLTAVTVAELRYGIARLPEGRRRDSLSGIADQLLSVMPVLPFDAAAAEQYALIMAFRDGVGRPMSPFDAQIAAVCLATGVVLATRNVKDFDGIRLTLINPWG
jgi:toxin FitB